jgi:hypothetical protein
LHERALVPRDRRFRIASTALVACTALSPDAHAEDRGTDEVEMSAFAGMHVRRDSVALPATFPPYAPLGAGAVGGVELGYRHDFAAWSLAGGLRVQYEAYELDAWLTPNDGPNQTFAPAPWSYTTATITSHSESIVAIGAPLRVEREVATSVALYVLVDPMIVAYTRRVVADYVGFRAPSEYGVVLRDDHQVFAVYGAAGVAVRVGPGRIFFELGGRGGADAHGTTGVFNPSGWSLVAGYRLGLR